MRTVKRTVKPHKEAQQHLLYRTLQVLSLLPDFLQTYLAALAELSLL